MKKFLLVIIVFCLTLVLLILNKQKFTEKPQALYISPSVKQAVTQAPKIISQKQQDLFVPYWSDFGKKIDSTGFNNLIYFGISASEEGVDTTDDGYKKLSKFLQSTDSNKRKILGFRLLNQDTNEKIINDKNIQTKIIYDTINLAKTNNFKGILLDFEYSALKFDDIVNKISQFENTFAAESHASNLKFYITAYGDSFYRARPFDPISISKNIDGIYVLAYDFHKINGNPGPNFPLNLRPDEDYSFKIMVNDFLKNISSEKIIMTFGTFGYDWAVGDKGNSVSQGVPVTFSEASKKFLDNCYFNFCKVIIDPVSSETEIKYKDSSGKNHDVWIETLNSIKAKEDFLYSKDVARTAIWAYSYF